jgi:hypothetical protein
MKARCIGKYDVCREFDTRSWLSTAKEGEMSPIVSYCYESASPAACPHVSCIVPLPFPHIKLDDVIAWRQDTNVKTFLRVTVWVDHASCRFGSPRLSSITSCFPKVWQSWRENKKTLYNTSRHSP